MQEEGTCISNSCRERGGQRFNVFGDGGGKFCCFKMVREKAGSGNPKTGSCTSGDPALVLDRFKFKSLICHLLATANICWFFC